LLGPDLPARQKKNRADRFIIQVQQSETEKGFRENSFSLTADSTLTGESAELDKPLLKNNRHLEIPRPA
jgi:hypothetical protein